MTPVSKNFAVKTEVLKANLVAVKKATDTTVTMTHYIDEASSGTSYNFSLVNASGRVANDVIEVYSTVGVFHGFKLVNIADDETKGFEPLFFSIYYRTVRENL
jgi:predicted phosphohydrolase